MLELLSCGNNLNTLTPRIISCSTTSLVPLEKYLFRKNKFGTINFCLFVRTGFMINKFYYFARDLILFSFKTVKKLK